MHSPTPNFIDTSSTILQHGTPITTGLIFEAKLYQQCVQFLFVGFVALLWPELMAPRTTKSRDSTVMQNNPKSCSNAALQLCPPFGQ
jgi:hypothetical protein